MSDFSIGLQLYTIRDHMVNDFVGSMRRVAELGYSGVEFAGYGNLSAQEMKALLNETGLKAASTHVSLQALEQDFEREIHYCLEIGAPFLIVPWIGEEWRTGEGMLKLSELLNKYGQSSMEHGVILGYHNHNFEFEQTPDGTLLEILMSATDPSLVKLELDTYWAAFAGLEPVPLIKQYAERVRLVHLKDMSTARTFTEVGAGTLDIGAYVRAAKEIGVSWGFVENDAPSIDSLESAKRSLANLQKLV